MSCLKLSIFIESQNVIILITFHLQQKNEKTGQPNLPLEVEVFDFLNVFF